MTRLTLLFLGKSGAGKTQLANRFSNIVFTDQHEKTTAVRPWIITKPDDIEYELVDMPADASPNEEQFSSADVVFYLISSASNIANIKNEISEIKNRIENKNNIGGKKTELIIIASKNDLPDVINPNQIITKDETFFSVSARNDNGIPALQKHVADIAHSRQVLFQLKTAVKHMFNYKYISSYKFSWFGHHHNGRAKELLLEIDRARSIDELKTILNKQKMLFDGKSTEIVSEFDKKWNVKLKNVPKNKEVSGYYKVVLEALNYCDNNPLIKPINNMTLIA